MSFLRQIKTEFRNILRVKFLLIFGILVLAASVIFPIFTALTATDGPTYPGGPGGPIMYTEAAVARYDIKEPGYPSDQQPITVDGVTIMPDNPYYWNVMSLQQQQTSMDSSMFTTPGALDIALRLIDDQLSYYVQFATYVTTYQDYRVDLAWNTQPLFDRFIYQNSDTEDPAELKEAVQFFMYMDPASYDEKYINITAEERLAALDTAETYIESLYSILQNNDFAKYVEMRIQQENDNIKSLQDQIDIQEQAIIDNPDQEDSLNQIIEDLKKQIAFIESNNIPILEYRLQKNIIPYTDVWQNTALDDITNCRQQLTYTTIMSEEDFNKDQYMAIQYGSYSRYVAAIQAQIDELNNKILIAQSCLDADKPDMKYVPNGARSVTVQALVYSIVVALFGILVGGWLMASEFQMGTIRLLMIRPKTRLKILMSKFLAGLLICLALYLVGTILNIVVNGICFGFGDFAFPNFTIAGEIGFFAFYIPKFFACMVSIIFAYCIAFMMSVVVKNIAIAIIVPVVCFIGSVVLMGMISYSMMDWIAFTPIPYIVIADFFKPVTNYVLPPVQSMIQSGVPISLTYGIIMLLVLSAVSAVVSILVFRKRDITN